MISLSTQVPAYLTANNLAVGEEVYPRTMATSIVSGPASSGSFRFTYFTARKQEVSTQVRMYSGSTAAGATPTLTRIGIYSIAANGDGTLVAATNPADTSLFAAVNSVYTRSWLAPFAKVAGQRYAIGPLVVSSFTIPTILGFIASLPTESAAQAPVLTGFLGGQTDLPASFTAGSVSPSNGQFFYAAVLP